ncbi:MAG: tetratricopeptide repeat protein [Comamonadaceae bacterium]|nr:tetratricopeptide repeat protein [Comamonadaceae bacterium]
MEALSELTTFTLMKPESADGWRQLDGAQFQLRQWPNASQSFERALKLRENQPEAWNGQGLVYAQKGQYREALNCFATALRQQTNFGPAL